MTNDTDMTDKVDVTQKDRNAAARWMEPDTPDRLMSDFAHDLRKGRDDGHSLVQAFALHRTEATAQLQAERDELVKAVISVREKAIAARNFLAIAEPEHADRHLRALIELCGEAAPEAIAAHDTALTPAPKVDVVELLRGAGGGRHDG